MVYSSPGIGESRPSSGLPIRHLGHSRWKDVLKKQCGFSEAEHFLRFTVIHDFEDETRYVFCKDQRRCAIQLMHEATVGIVLEIVLKSGGYSETMSRVILLLITFKIFMS
jgi:hypothetical protein